MGDRQATDSVGQLVSAGVSILGTEGSTRVTVRSVATLAGVSGTTVQHYFRTKEHLLNTLYDEALRRDTERLTSLDATLPSAESEEDRATILRELVRGLLSDACGINASRTLARVAALAGIARHDESHASARIWFARSRQLLARALTRLVPRPRASARFLLELLCGIELVSLGCRHNPLVPMLNAELLDYGVDAVLGRKPQRCPAWFKRCATDVLHQRREDPNANDKTPHARAEILAASARILADHGPAELTHRNVAKEAGVAASLVSYHFRAKTDLLYGAYRYIHDRFTHEQAPANQPHVDWIVTKRAGARPAYVASLEAIVAAAFDPEMAPFAWVTRMTRGVYYLHHDANAPVDLGDKDFNVHAFSIWLIGATLAAEACWTSRRRARCLLSRMSVAQALFPGH